jgi:hypothetical protein
MVGVLHLYRNLAVDTNRTVTLLQFGYPFNGSAAIGLGHLVDAGLLLVAGPVWLSSKVEAIFPDSRDIDYDRIAQQIIQIIDYSMTHVPNAAQDLRVLKQGYYPLTTRTRLMRAARARKAVSSDDLLARCDSVRFVLNGLLKSPLLHSTFAKADIASVLSVASFFSQNNRMLRVGTTKADCRADILMRDAELMGTSPRGVRIEMRGQNIRIDRLNGQAFPKVRSVYFHIKGAHFEDIHQYYSRFLDNEFSVKTNYYREVLQGLERWLHDQFGGLLGDEALAQGKMSVAKRRARAKQCGALSTRHLNLRKCSNTNGLVGWRPRGARRPVSKPLP